MTLIHAFPTRAARLDEVTASSRLHHDIQCWEFVSECCCAAAGLMRKCLAPDFSPALSLSVQSLCLIAVCISGNT